MDYSNIILEMLDRIQRLEKEIEMLKNKPQTTAESFTAVTDLTQLTPAAPVPMRRDTTRYMWNGNVYLKNRLVLAIVRDYVANNPSITILKLKQTFDKSLQGSIGVVEDARVAVFRHDCDTRFFAKENEKIDVTDGQVFVCSQWGILNISNFIKRAKQLGYQIEEIKKEI